MNPNAARPVVALVPPSCCGAGYFRPLRRALAGRVEVRAVELPGHGRRYQEPRITDAGIAVRDIARQIGGPVDAVYGESLGAYLGLAMAGLLGPHRTGTLIAVSNSPPRNRDPIDTAGIVSAGTAAALLAKMGGEIPAEALADPVLAASIYPMVRDDLCLAASLLDATRALAIAADIYVLGGAADASLRGLPDWAGHTTGRCQVTRLPGGHLLSAANPVGVATLIVRSVVSRRAAEEP
jgi:surfactin synthase thioesterase subunit